MKKYIFEEDEAYIAQHIDLDEVEKIGMKSEEELQK